MAMQPQKKVKITKTLWECDPRKLKQKHMDHMKM